MTTLNPGDVVRLKSGGPRMTVDTVSDRYGTLTAWTSWFEGTKPQSGTYPVTSLEIVSPDNKVGKAAIQSI
jgi:uncharacterized protein YodC (DUF2158 family)